MKFGIHLFLILLLSTSCTSKVEVKGQKNPSGAIDEYIPPVIEDIIYENGQLKITGKSLQSVKLLNLI